MNDDLTSREQLQQEVVLLRQRIVELEDSDGRRRLADEALRKSEAKYRRLAENLPAVVYQFEMLADGAFSFPYISASVREVAGVTAEDAIEESATLLGRIHPDDVEMFRAGVLKSARGNEPYRATFRFMRGEETRWVQLRSTPEALPDGGVLWDGFFMDITERKQAEAALHHKTAELDVIFEALPDLCFRFDSDRTIVGYFAGRTTDLYMEPEAFLGQRLGDILPPDVSGRCVAAFDQVAAGALIGNFEYSLSVPAGEKSFEGRVLPLPEGHFMVVIRDITERARAVEALTDTRAFLTNIVDAIADPVFVKDESFEFMLANNALCSLLGKGRDEIIGTTGLDYLPSDQMDHFLEVDRNVLSSGVENQSEEFLTDGDGKVRTIVTKKTRYVDLHGAKFIVGVIRDVTEQKRAEEQLRKSETQHRQAQRVAHIGHWELESYDGTPRWSDEVFRIFGVDPQTGVPSFTSHDTIIHPDEWPLLDRTIQEGFELGKPFDLTFRILGPAGVIGWMQAIGESDIDGDGKVVRMFGTAQDITQRRRADDALRESEEQFRTLVEQSTSAIEIYAPDGTLLLTNDAWATMWNLEKEDVAGFNIFRDPQCETTGLTPAFREALAGRSRVIPDTSYDPDDSGFIDGRVRWMSARMYPIKDRGGEVRNVVLTYDDITMRKLAEVDRAELQERLQQSQKMEAIGRLAGGVAHDFNNLLTGIVGYASEMQLELDPDDPHALTTMEILTICKRARDLTMNLLGFARKGKFHKQRLDLGESIREAQGILKQTISKKITFESRIADNLPGIEGDAGQINQILMNLCINAADAMGHSGGTMSVAAREAVIGPDEHTDLEPGHYVELSVTDTGEGMDVEILAKAFEPFFTTKPLGRGTGLGLSMVYGAVRNHGGAVTLDSKQGQGTRVAVLLPALQADTELAPPAPSLRAALTPGQGLILLVDDERLVRNATSRLLMRCGYQVVMAENGEAAVAAYRERSDEIDLVLLDMSMPVMDGPETFHELKKINPAVRVLIFSGYSSDATTNELMGHGAVGFIQKPFSLAKLTDVVANALAR